MSTPFDPYHRWLGIPPAEQPADHYRLLGIARFESDPDVIQEAADRQMAHVQNHKAGRYSELSQKLLNELSQAKLVLLAAEKKEAYDRQLKQQLKPAAPPPKKRKRKKKSAAEPAARTDSGDEAVPVIVAETSPTSTLPYRRRRASQWQIPAAIGATSLGVIGILLVLLMQEPPGPSTSAEPEQVANRDGFSRDEGFSPGKERSLPGARLKPRPFDLPESEDPPKPAAKKKNDPQPRPTDQPPTRPRQPLPQPEHEPAPQPEPPPQPESPPQPEPKAVPDEAARKKAARIVDEVYRDKLAQAKTTEDKAKIAAQLYREAQASKQPAEQFVLLERAAELASESGQFVLAWRSLDDAGKRFATDVLPRKEQALIEAAKFAKTPPEFKSVAQSWLVLLNEAVAGDRYGRAVRFAEAAAQAARRSEHEPFERLVRRGLKEIRELQSAYGEVADLPMQIRAGEGDPAAQARWGRFLCAYKNDWQHGLPLWAQGDDPLAALAERELKQPRNPAAQLELADAWWQAAEGAEHLLPQKFFGARAVHWYRQAAPHLSGLAQKQSRHRVEEYAEKWSGVPYGDWMEAGPMINPSGHSVAGQWGRRGTQIGNIKPSKGARVGIPLALSGSYEFQVRFKIASGHEAFVVLPAGDRQCALVMGAAKGQVSGIDQIGGRAATKNPSTVKQPVPPGRWHRLEVQVTVEGAQVTLQSQLNGMPFVSWKGSRSLLSADKSFAMPRPVIGLGGNDSLVLFQNLRLKVIGGGAEIL